MTSIGDTVWYRLGGISGRRPIERQFPAIVQTIDTVTQAADLLVALPGGRTLTMPTVAGGTGNGRWQASPDWAAEV